MSDSSSSSRHPSPKPLGDLYDILGVRTGATAEEIRRGYKQRALETHPDKLDRASTAEEKEEAEQNFHKVHEAFEILSDATKRKEYDRQHGIRPDNERRWGIFTDEANLRRAQERQAWAEKAEARFQSRMAKIRESGRQKREEFLEQQKANREQAEMIARMLDALCQLDSGEQEKERERKRAKEEEAKRVKEAERRKARLRTKYKPSYDNQSEMQDTHPHGRPPTIGNLQHHVDEDTKIQTDSEVREDDEYRDFKRSGVEEN